MRNSGRVFFAALLVAIAVAPASADTIVIHSGSVGHGSHNYELVLSHVGDGRLFDVTFTRDPSHGRSVAGEESVQDFLDFFLGDVPGIDDDSPFTSQDWKSGFPVGGGTLHDVVLSPPDSWKFSLWMPRGAPIQRLFASDPSHWLGNFQGNGRGGTNDPSLGGGLGAAATTEPSTLVIMGTGLLGLATMLRRRQQR